MNKILLVILSFLVVNTINAQVFVSDDFESYEPGIVNLPNAGEENCIAFKRCNDGVCPEKPLSISTEYSLSGSKSLRFEFDKNNFILHHDNYCAIRNEIRYEANVTYGSEVWMSFSIYPCLDKCGGTKYNSAGDTWIFQIKNEEGSGNRGGIQIRGDFFSTKKENGLNLGTVNYNAWNHIIVHVVYNSKINGGVREYWINGVKTVDPFNFDNSSGKIDFKLGCYGWHPNGKVVHFVDNVKIVKGSSSYDELSLSTSLVNKTVQNNLCLFPNPLISGETLNIDYVANNKNAYIEIASANGRALFRKNLDNNHIIKIDQQFDSGLYLVRLVDGEHIFNQKFIATRN